MCNRIWRGSFESKSLNCKRILVSRISSVSRSHKTHEFFSFLRSDSGGFGSWKIYYSALQVVHKYDKSSCPHPTLSAGHISLPAWWCPFEQSIFVSLDKGFVAWFKQLPSSSGTFFVDLSTQFVQTYALLIQKPKWTNSLFEVVKYPQEFLKNFMDRFEAALKFVANPDQFLTYTTFMRRLMHDPTACNHSMLNNLVVGCIKRYRDAQPIISCFLKLVALKRFFPSPS